MYDECCQQQGGWVAVVIIVIIVLILLFIIQSQRTKTTTTTPIVPDIVPGHDYAHGYSDVNNGSIEPFEPLELNSQIFAPNTQIVFDPSNSSFTFPPGSYKFDWSVGILDLDEGETDAIGFGLSATTVPTSSGPYPAPPFLEGSCFECRHIVNRNSRPRINGFYIATFDSPTTVQLRECLGTRGLVIGTESGEGLDLVKTAFSVHRLDDPVALP